jgi:hypothetical protein
MPDLHELAEDLRALEANAKDAMAIAQGLRDAAAVCSNEQAALKKRLEVAAVALVVLRSYADNAAATLRGLREMAAIQAAAGSIAWHNAIALIDASLRELSR